jgi:nucleoside-diphosphate-sugar epimerase
MKIAITGATGLIRGALARELVARGHEVVVIARGSDGREMQVKHPPPWAEGRERPRLTPAGGWGPAGTPVGKVLE